MSQNLQNIQKLLIEIQQRQESLKPVQKTFVFLTPHISKYMEKTQTQLQKLKTQNFNQAMKVYYHALAYQQQQNVPYQTEDLVQEKTKNFTYGIHEDEKANSRIICIPIHALSLTQDTYLDTYQTLFIQSQFIASLMRKTKSVKILCFMGINDPEQVKMVAFDDTLKKLKEQFYFPDQMNVNIGFVVKSSLDQEQFSFLSKDKAFQKYYIYFIKPNCKDLYIVNKRKKNEPICSLIQMNNLELGVVHKGFSTIDKKLSKQGSSPEKRKVYENIVAKAMDIKTAYQKSLNNPFWNFISLFSEVIVQADKNCQENSLPIENSSQIPIQLTQSGFFGNGILTQSVAFKKGSGKQIMIESEIEKNAIFYSKLSGAYDFAAISDLMKCKCLNISYKKLSINNLFIQDTQIQSYLDSKTKLPQKIKDLFALNQIKNIRIFLSEAATRFTTDPKLKSHQLQFPYIKMIVQNLFGFLYNVRQLFQCLRNVNFEQMINLLQFYLKVLQIHIKSTSAKSALLDNISSFLKNKSQINQINIVHYLKRIPSEENQSLMYYDIFENILKSNQNAENRQDGYLISKNITVKFNKAKLLFDNHLDSNEKKIEALKIFYLDIYQQLYLEKRAPYFDKKDTYAEGKFTAMSILIYSSKLLACINKPNLALIVQKKLQRYDQVYKFYKQFILKLNRKSAIQQQEKAATYFCQVMQYEKTNQFCNSIIKKCITQKELQKYQQMRYKFRQNQPKTEIQMIQAIEMVRNMKNAPIDDSFGQQIKNIGNQ